MALIEEITQAEDLLLDDKAQIFIKLAAKAADKWYDGQGDRNLNFIECCVELADTQTLRIVCENLLAQAVNVRNGALWSGNYYAERANLIRYKMVAR